MSSNCTINFRLFVQKRNIEFQIDQSHSAKLSGLPNAIGQFTFQYCVFVDNQLALTISRNGTERTGTLHYFTERNGRYCQFHFLLISLRFERSLVPRPSTPPVFDRLQYAKTEGEGRGNFITWSAARLTSQILDATDYSCSYSQLPRS